MPSPTDTVMINSGNKFFAETIFSPAPTNHTHPYQSQPNTPTTNTCAFQAELVVCVTARRAKEKWAWLAIYVCMHVGGGKEKMGVVLPWEVQWSSWSQPAEWRWGSQDEGCCSATGGNQYVGSWSVGGEEKYMLVYVSCQITPMARIFTWNQNTKYAISLCCSDWQTVQENHCSTLGNFCYKN